jgi:hypothetical protein
MLSTEDKEAVNGFFSRKRRQHEADVALFLEGVPSKLDFLLVDENIDEGFFYQQVQSLAKKWYGEYAPIGDCDGKRLMNNVLIREINNPLFVAVVVGRLDLFIKSFLAQSPNPRSSFHWLEVACICGAENIVGYMLGQIEQAVWLRSPDIIDYALASGDEAFAMEMARLMQACSGSKPRYLHIYSFGKFGLADEIERLFSTSVLSQKSH